MKPFYDPQKTYEENFHEGPFSGLAGGEVYENSGEPKFNFLGQKVFLPFGIAAGPLLNGKYIKAALDKGFDIVTYKTVRSAQYPCNPWPNVVAVNANPLTLEMAAAGVVKTKDFTEPVTITNSFGVPSWNPDFWQKDMNDAVKYAREGQVVIGSFQGTPRGDEQKYIRDFADTAKLVKETGVKVLEVNLSCPNEGTAHLLCFDIERATKVVEAIKNEIGNTPLIIKIAYYADQGQLEKLIENIGNKVEGVEVINTIMSKILDENGKPGFLDGRTHSGVAGAGIKWAGLEMTERAKKLRKEKAMKFSVIGCGGVRSAEDYNQYVEKGADAVMSVTGAMWNSFLAQEIKKTIKA